MGKLWAFLYPLAYTLATTLYFYSFNPGSSVLALRQPRTTADNASPLIQAAIIRNSAAWSVTFRNLGGNERSTQLLGSTREVPRFLGASCLGLEKGEQVRLLTASPGAGFLEKT